MPRIPLFAALALLSAGALISCNNDDDNSMPAELPVRILNEAEYYGNEFQEYTAYQYDQLGRAIEINTIYADETMSTMFYIYSDSLVLGYDYSTYDDKPYLETHYLNPRGLVDSTVFRYDGEDRAVMRYLYNDEGYKVWSKFESKQYAMLFEDQYQYENGNVSRLVSRMTFGTPDTEALPEALLVKSLNLSPADWARLQSRMQGYRQQTREQEIFQDTLYYEYLPQRNTLSDHNRGRLFTGRPNQNLVLQYTYQDGPDSEVISYEYLFDSKGRAIKQIEPDVEIPLVYDYSYTD